MLRVINRSIVPKPGSGHNSSPRSSSIFFQPREKTYSPTFLISPRKWNQKSSKTISSSLASILKRNKSNTKTSNTSSTNEKPILQLKGVTKTLSDGRILLEDVAFTIFEGLLSFLTNILVLELEFWDQMVTLFNV
jgi:hypothetical protein